MTSQLIEISQNYSFRYSLYDTKWNFEMGGYHGDDVTSCVRPSPTKSGHRIECLHREGMKQVKMVEILKSA